VLARLPEVLDANHYAPLRDGDHVILLAAGICMEEIGDHMSSGHACLQWVTNSVADDLSESDAPPVQEVVPVA
jgi:hypothetical protein